MVPVLGGAQWTLAVTVPKGTRVESMAAQEVHGGQLQRHTRGGAPRGLKKASLCGLSVQQACSRA
jgi:hypothetical protein